MEDGTTLLRQVQPTQNLCSMRDFIMANSSIIWMSIPVGIIKYEYVMLGF